MNNAGQRFSETERPAPRVSVIIPTYNRKQELASLLAVLEKQTLPRRDFEIIVVDDGSTDDTLQYLKHLIAGGRESLCFCYQKNQGPGVARNRGMALARGELFAFTDTDCRPLPDWLEKLIEPFSDTRVGAVGGAETCDAGTRGLARAIHFCMTSHLATGGIRGGRGATWARYYPRTFNMAISRAAFERTGGFKPLYHGEDIELSFRIKKAGFSLIYQETAQVCHQRRATIKQFFLQLMQMGEARVALARQHSAMLEPLHVVPAAALLALGVALVLAVFSEFFRIVLYLLCAVGLLFVLLLGTVGSKDDTVPRTEKIKLFVLVPVVYILQQTAYGIGCYRGLWAWLKEWGAQRHSRQEANHSS